MSRTRYPIPAELHRSQIEIERSRFITNIAPVASPQAAQDFIAGIKQEFPTANHNCWAYLIGAPDSSDTLGYSDDGEPHGCAGKPMLTVLQHSDLGDVAVVVSRYFGGIKLGKGGMVKAYTQAVQTAIEQLPIAEKIDWRQLSVRVDYAQLDNLKRLLPEFEAELVDTEFTAQVCLRLQLPAEQLERLKKQLINLTAGQVDFLRNA